MSEAAQATMPAARAPLNAPVTQLVLGTIGSVLLLLGGYLVGVPSTHDQILQSSPFTDLRALVVPGVAMVFAGLSLLVLAWWRLRGELATTTTRGLIVTLAAWGTPLLVAVPTFSRDVFSYLAQGTMTAIGIDPYVYGPAILGGPLAQDIPEIWLTTPAPYGPVFLGLAADVMSITGQHTWVGILLMRLLAIAGVALIVYGVMRVARSAGVDERQALWLGVLNPLTIIHLMGDSHNDALMLGLMLTGIAIALDRHPLSPIAGVALVTLGALVKAPAALAVIFIVPIWASHMAGRARWIRAGLATAGVSLATVVVTTRIADTGYGWVAALGTPTKAHTWTSITTDLGFWTGLVMRWLGVGSEELALSAWRAIGLLAAGVLALEFLRRYHRDAPVTGLGLGMGAVLAFGPVLHPWYLLWAIIPLAASARSPRIRTWVHRISLAMMLTVLPGGVQPGPAVFLGAAIGVVLVFGAAWIHQTGLRPDDMAASLRGLLPRRARRDVEEREPVSINS